MSIKFWDKLSNSIYIEHAEVQDKLFHFSGLPGMYTNLHLTEDTFQRVFHIFFSTKI